MNDISMETLAIIWIACAFLGALVGQSKGKGGTGFVLGLLLGLIGVLITGLLTKTPEKQAADIVAVRQVLGAQNASITPQGAWWPDPMGRHLLRYYDGSRWTDYVSNHGQQSIDLLNQPS